MKTFKQFRTNPQEFATFANAGGPIGQYDDFDFSQSDMRGQGGGKPEPIGENLNPRNSPIIVNSTSHILTDPEKSNKGLGNHPPAGFLPNYHGTEYVEPHFNDEQARNARILSQHTNDNEEYHSIITPYTSSSNNLNKTLYQCQLKGTKPPRIIKSNTDKDVDYPTDIDTEKFDSLIRSYKLPHGMTVYTGLYFHPNDNHGKIAHVPSYLSTSLSPHVAKDFGKRFSKGDSVVKYILRIQLPKGQEYLFADNGSFYPGEGELILPRGSRFQFGHTPTHIIHGKFVDHVNGNIIPGKIQYQIYNGRLLPRGDR